MSNFFAAVWDLHVGLLRVIGNVVLVLLGIALCGYAMILQFDDRHSNLIDSAIFAAGISLVAFSFLRRLVWNVVGLAIPWTAVVAGGIYLAAPDVHRLALSPELVILFALPPLAGAFLLELLPKAPATSREPQLEINMNEPTPPPD